MIERAIITALVALVLLTALPAVSAVTANSFKQVSGAMEDEKIMVLETEDTILKTP